MTRGHTGHGQILYRLVGELLSVCAGPLLEVNADKTKYMVMSLEQTAGLSHYEGR